MGKGVTIEVLGVDRLNKHLDKISQMNNLREAVARSTGMVEASAKTLCPVDTGNLRSSIHSGLVDDRTGKVSTNCEYAPYVEFGTGRRGANSNYPKASKLGLSYGQRAGQVAQPFLYPALKQNESRIKALINNAIGEELH